MFACLKFSHTGGGRKLKAANQYLIKGGRKLKAVNVETGKYDPIMFILGYKCNLTC